MTRLSMIFGLIALGVFNYGQYRGWDMFSDEARAQPVRSASGLNHGSGYNSYGGSRGYHK